MRVQKDLQIQAESILESVSAYIFDRPITDKERAQG